jgi:hypothetical protein
VYLAGSVAAPSTCVISGVKFSVSLLLMNPSKMICTFSEVISVTGVELFCSSETEMLCSLLLFSMNGAWELLTIGADTIEEAAVDSEAIFHSTGKELIDKGASVGAMED